MIKLAKRVVALAALAIATAAAVAGPVGTAAAAPASSTHNQAAAQRISVPASSNAPKGTALPHSLSPDISPSWDQEMWNFAHPENCMDDSSGSGLRMYGCSLASYDNGYQDWQVINVNSRFKLKNRKTGLCLDGSIGAGVRAITCSDASYNNGYQKWVGYIYDASNHVVDWQNSETGECLDYSAGNGLRLYTCSAASYNDGYQMWGFEG